MGGREEDVGINSGDGMIYKISLGITGGLGERQVSVREKGKELEGVEAGIYS